MSGFGQLVYCFNSAVLGSKGKYSTLGKIRAIGNSGNGSWKQKVEMEYTEMVKSSHKCALE